MQMALTTTATLTTRPTTTLETGVRRTLRQMGMRIRSDGVGVRNPRHKAG